MTRQRFLSNDPPTLDLGLTIEDLMHDLDPNWDSWSPTDQAAAADVAELLAVLA